jgi:serine protease
VARNTTGTASSATWSFTTAAQTGSGTATISSPTPSTQLPMNSVTFSWGPITGADQYWLDVGSRVSVGDYFGQATTSTSLMVSSLPCDGRTVFVQLFTHIQGAWQTPMQYTYTASTGCAALTTPAANATLSGSSQTFSWVAISGADQYWLDVGNALREGDIHGAATTATSVTVTGIPCDGRNIFGQLWTHEGGVWQNPGEYLFKAASSCSAGGGGGGGGTGPSPAPGSTLTSPSQVFSWSAVSGADEYWLDVGSHVATGDYFGSATTSTSLTVNTLPCDGRTVYVQEWVHLGGVWQTPTQLTYTAASGCAALTAPANGSTFTDTTVNFAFAAVTGADQYWLDVGNSVGHGDIFGAATTGTSFSVANVPCDGRPLFVQLWTHKGGVWLNPGRYQFTAWGACGALTSPAPNTTLSGSTVTFSWTAGTGVTAYWLDVGTVVGSGAIFGANVGTVLTKTVTGIPTNGVPIYVQLWSQIGGVWRLNRYTYTAF